jgi:hypothetical protein
MNTIEQTTTSSSSSSSNSSSNFKKHYDKHGWAISDYVFDSESEADNVLKKLLNVYERTSVKGLLTWSTTAGNGTRA